LIRNRDYTKPVGVERDRLLLSRFEMAFVKPSDFRTKGVVRARRENLFDGALANENVLAVFPRDHDRQTAARKIEGDFIELRIPAGDVQCLLEFEMRQNRFVEQVPEP